MCPSGSNYRRLMWKVILFHANIFYKQQILANLGQMLYVGGFIYIKICLYMDEYEVRKVFNILFSWIYL